MDSSKIPDISRERLRYTKEQDSSYDDRLYSIEREDKELEGVLKRYRRALGRLDLDE